MQLSNAPSQLVLPFANSGLMRTVPIPSQVGTAPGAASYTDGFPPLTMTAVTSGGVPPSGLDMNGVLNEMSASDVWACAGAGYQWNSTYAATIGGYPMGAQVLNAAGTGYWQSLIDNNPNNPDTGGAGWIPGTLRAIASVWRNDSYTIGTGDQKIVYDTVEFDSYGLWNSGAAHFVAKWAGVYRLTGAIYFAAPAPQLMATKIAKNSTVIKQCFQAPQVSDGPLMIPFAAMILCAAGDYLDAYLNVTTTAVLAGVDGAGAIYNYAQIEYLGS